MVTVRGRNEVHVFRDFAALTPELSDQLAAGNRLVQINAIGRYNATVARVDDASRELRVHDAMIERRGNRARLAAVSTQTGSMASSMSNAAALNRYLAGVEQRAFRMARYAVSDIDEAMDIVQDAMLTLARKYATKPEAEWPPLFFRILRNRITDFHRRRTVQRGIFAMFTPRRWRRRYEPDRSRQRWSRVWNRSFERSSTSRHNGSKARLRLCPPGSAKRSCCACGKVSMWRRRRAL